MKEKNLKITFQIPVDLLREEAVGYMKDVFAREHIHPDICPNADELESRFNRNIQEPHFIRYLQTQVCSIVICNLGEIFEGYEDDYIQDILERNNGLDVSTERKKHIESAKAKLTPEERRALGLET